MFLSHLAKMDKTEAGGFKILGPSAKVWDSLVDRYDGKEFVMYYTAVNRKDNTKMVWFYKMQILPKIEVKTGMGIHTHSYCSKTFGFGEDVSGYTFEQLHMYIETLKEFFQL